MPTGDTIIIIFISLSAFAMTCLVFLVVYRMKQMTSESKELSKRLHFWLSEKSSEAKYRGLSLEQLVEEEKQTEDNFTKRVLIPLGEQVGQWMAGKVPYNKLSALRKLLIKAGFRDKKAYQFFYASKIVSLIAFGGGIFFGITMVANDPGAGLFFGVLAGAYGYIFPNSFLEKNATKRQQNIDRILPDALDLLVICTEAGMGIDQSLLRLAANLGKKGKELTEEIILTNREMNLGQERTVCWNNMGDRTLSEELKSLARVITQSEKVGSSISNVLRSQSEFLRVRRRQKAEETAAKMTIKMMIPMAIFIFPCIMAVTLGPPILKLVSTFKASGQL